jgi:3',5'-cyclic AMP phosphodiesterase CpdA
VAAGLVSSGALAADFAGVIFADRDGDGARGAAEPGLPGVLVSNGLDVVRSDEQGRYRLPAVQSQGPADGTGGFVFATRPDGYGGGTWYREGGGDIGLVPESGGSGDEFFFIHYSDSHVYDRTSDFREFSTQPRWWIPEIVQNWMVLQFGARIVSPFTDDLAAGLRKALAPYRDADLLADAWDTTVLSEFLLEFERPESQLGDAPGRAQAAFAEMARLRPAFYVATGDLVLEGNQSPPEPIERWMTFYKRLRDSLGAPVYDTIGNNEIAGNENEAFPADDPRFGKNLYRKHFGPTRYSFDRGPFHFVAFDTHGPLEDASGEWSYARLSADAKQWADRDLAAHEGRVLVALNHEPFHFDPRWPFEPDPEQTADDAGLFAKHAVAYSLAGHTHLNGFEERDGTTHITTGALSGFRWVLPDELFHTGYRLFYAKDGALYSAWKRLGHPLLAFVQPLGDPASHPASAGAAPADALNEPLDVVAVAVDHDGAFPGVRLELDGAGVAFERWGDYFLRARIDPEAMEADTGTLTLSAITLDGRFEKADLTIERTRP